MTAAALNVTAQASSLPNLSAGVPTGISQKVSGTQSFAQALKSQETQASSPSQAPSHSGTAAKAKPQSDSTNQPQNKTGKSPQKDAQSASQEVSEEAAAQTQTTTQVSKPNATVGKDGKTLSDDKETGDEDTDDDISLCTDPEASVLAAMGAANMAAQPASDAGKGSLELKDGVVDKQDDITDLLLKDSTDGKADAKKLLQLGSMDEPAKSNMAAKTDKDTQFDSLLTQSLDKQGTNSLQGNSQAATTVASNPLSGSSAPARQVVSTPVATQGWSDEVAQKVSWTAHNGNGRAELVLTPAHMGRIEVSIHMHGDQASATFIVANAHAREALQDAMPQLREVLSNAGIQLGQANVNANSSGQNWSGAPDQSGFQGGTYATTGGNALDIGIEGINPQSTAVWSSGGNGLVDIFA